MNHTEPWRLIALAGAHAGTTWTIGSGTLRVGRDPDCEIVVEDGAASRLHAEFTVVEGKLYVRDLDSTNRTYVNNRAVTRAALEPDDIVQIAETRIRVEPPRAAAGGGAPVAAEPTGARIAHGTAATGVDASPGSRRRVRVLAIALLAVIVTLAVVVVLSSGGGRENEAPASAPPVVEDSPVAPDPAVPVHVPPQAVEHFERGLTSYQFGRLREARDALQEALRIAADFGDARDLLARTERAIDARIEDLMRQAGENRASLRREAAILALEEVIEIAPAGDARRDEAERMLAVLREPQQQR